MTKEDIYIKKLNEYVSSEGLRKLAEIKLIQEKFFCNSINSLNDSGYNIKDNFYACCDEIAQIAAPTIDYLMSKKNVSSIIISNHIGLAKLIKLNVSDLNIKDPEKTIMKELANNESYILRVAIIISHLRKINKEITIHPITIKYNYPFSELCTKASFFMLLKENNFERIKSYIESSIQNSDKTHCFIIFPEGKTSGKYNGKHIFDLEQFHTGFYELARQTKLPIVSYTQFFNPDLNFHITISDKTHHGRVEDIRNEMQKNLTPI